MNGKRLQFAASPSIVAKVRDAVRRTAAGLGAAEEVGDQLALIADELLNNAIEHGAVYRRRGDSLALEIAVAGERLRVEFYDPEMPGELVAKLAAQVAAAGNGLPDVESERGRGLFLLTVFLQDVRIESAPKGGLRITGHVATS